MLAKQLLRALPRRGMRSMSVAAVDAGDEEHGGLSFALTDDQKVVRLCRYQHYVDARRARRGVESGRGTTARPQKEAQK